jgi:pimeloyl-ACP methyl ester carboxylesterase
MTELRELTAVDLVDLPTGHWPQLTKPAEFTELLVAILAR